jgi:chromosome transmission fidelity protein 1
MWWYNLKGTHDAGAKRASAGCGLGARPHRSHTGPAPRATRTGCYHGRGRQGPPEHLSSHSAGANERAAHPCLPTWLQSDASSTSLSMSCHTRCCASCLQGMVVFFPSFAYADQVWEHWQASGTLSALTTKKRVFREPRSSVGVDAVLR